ncbi:histidine triad nucleotide-binding protein [Pseudomonadales bacterium]|nr:histidine triad nucleotide-binding protein [Pseudomonadales bacterium]MDA9064253.1 histidine triad nucleotide-binding protein [Pseudomonadales bacterium]MDA9315895.1 histidine triad nucleotide-binding protein [Pseudomonadales bacterium]MDB4069029.1 histidine triad nucleotide-binding protein [Pseudomonadales bacterium]MDB9867914.1 histidine triad nucleotide-binding protein [Pseudomonadales bacterium]|tara:strand:- start:261 stop:605 length:345 start_codon:yes stop_codon:yes gene_type:complete
MTDNCLFCKIASKQIPADLVYEDEQIMAFKDISPQAPVHQLIIPKQHITTLNDVDLDHRGLLGHMVFTATQLAAEQNLSEPGFRLIMNCNQDGGQTVFHIHLHLLGGRQLTHLG